MTSQQQGNIQSGTTRALNLFLNQPLVHNMKQHQIKVIMHMKHVRKIVCIEICFLCIENLY